MHTLRKILSNNKYFLIWSIITIALAVILLVPNFQDPNSTEVWISAQENNIENGQLESTEIEESILRQELNEILAENTNPEVLGTSNDSEVDTFTTRDGRVLEAGDTFSTQSTPVRQSTYFLSSTGEALLGGVNPAASATATYLGKVTLENAEYDVFIPQYDGSSGAIGIMNQGISFMYDQRSASIASWGQMINDKATIPIANAQDTNDASLSPNYQPGAGSALLQPIQGLWSAAANLVYIFYILIIIGIGIAIVFRSKLDGQNVVNLFNTIPSLIISLILVYFSYPLSAVFIDFVTVGSSAVYGVLIGDDANSGAPGAFLHEEELLAKSILDKVGLIGGGESVNARTGLQIDDRYINIWRAYDTAGINPTLDGSSSLIPQEAPVISSLQRFFGGSVGSAVDNSAGLFDTILALVFAFAALTASFKLFFGLLQEYIILIVYPIISPFIFLIAAIPSRTNGTIGFYFRRLLAATVSFIGIYALFLVIIIISRQPVEVGDILWAPPLLGYSADQLNGGGSLFNESIIQPLIGYGLFIISPQVKDFIVKNVGPDQEQGPWFETLKNETQAAGKNLITGFGVGDQIVKQQIGIDEQRR